MTHRAGVKFSVFICGVKLTPPGVTAKYKTLNLIGNYFLFFLLILNINKTNKNFPIKYLILKKKNMNTFTPR